MRASPRRLAGRNRRKEVHRGGGPPTLAEKFRPNSTRTHVKTARRRRGDLNLGSLGRRERETRARGRTEGWEGNRRRGLPVHGTDTSPWHDNPIRPYILHAPPPRFLSRAGWGESGRGVSSDSLPALMSWQDN